MNKVNTAILLLPMIGLLSGCPEGGGMSTQGSVAATSTPAAAAAPVSAPASSPSTDGTAAIQKTATFTDLWTQTGAGIYYSSGNVGIGTSNPMSSLDVIANEGSGTHQAHFFNTSIGNGQNTLIAIGQSANTDSAVTLSYMNSSTTANKYFDISHWGHGGQLVVQDSGNIGIGTTTPISTLDVINGGGAGTHMAHFFTPKIGNGQNTMIAIGQSANTDSAVTLSYMNSSTTANKYFDISHWGHGGQLVIQDTGFVGIGTTAPSYTLDVAGVIRVSGLLYNSDSRLKEHVEEIPDSLQKILTLKGVTYNWNNLARQKGLQDTSRQMGLIAQDVEKIFPEAVQTANDGYKTVNYPALVAPLVQAVKQLESENELLRKRLEKIEARLH
jgi:phosphoribosyl-AMP cyclohydrolase